MDLNTVLGLLDEHTRINAYKQSMSKLESSPNLDLDALKLCIKLRPSPESAPGDANRLFDLLTQRIPHEPLDSDHFFHLAEIFSIDGAFMDTLFRKILPVTGKVHLPELSKRLDEQAESSAQQNIRKATAYLTLSKCSYWLPSSSNHFLVPFTLNLLSNFLGSPGLDGYALDAISALLSLLRREKQIVVASAYDTPTPWLKSTSNPGRATLAEPIVNESFWNRLSALGLEYIMSSRSTYLHSSDDCDSQCTLQHHTSQVSSSACAIYRPARLLLSLW
jgi:tRNA guanosine-2'-O-methyltransferase